MSNELHARPLGITALIIFFLAGTLISFVAAVSLVVPSPFFESMWHVNPRGHDGLIRIGLWGTALILAASISSGPAAIRLSGRAPWGPGIAVSLITISILSDFTNAALGT